MNIMLYDVDSTIPNLALMKLSTYHKALGDTVGFHSKNPDRIYASCIFKKNRHLLDGLKYYYPDAEIITGGTGLSLETTLSPDIESMMPDYSLYPNCDYSMGFTTRGCIRKCHFCVVPRKEGPITRWHHPQTFYNKRFSKIMLLDNNWLALSDWFFETSAWIKDMDLSIIEHGLDIRLLNEENTKRLRELSFVKVLHFAFDNDALESTIREKCKLLEDAGFNLRGEIMFYIYVDSDDMFDSGLHRCNVLKELNTNPFVMYNIDKKRTTRIKHLQRWANKKQIFWRIPFEEYL